MSRLLRGAELGVEVKRQLVIGEFVADFAVLAGLDYGRRRNRRCGMPRSAADESFRNVTR